MQHSSNLLIIVKLQQQWEMYLKDFRWDFLWYFFFIICDDCCVSEFKTNER